MGKKTKAIKVTDQGKPWEKRKNSYQYEAIRRANKTILIVCEGQTEEWYFSKFPVISLSVRCVNLQGQSKMNLVQATQEIVKNEDFIFDEVWCVFDMDVQNMDKDFTNFDNSIDKAKSLSYNVAARAEKLHLRQKDLPYHQQKPVTLVYQLVQLLNEYKRV